MHFVGDRFCCRHLKVCNTKYTGQMEGQVFLQSIPFLAIGYARIGNTTTKLVHMHSKGRIPSQALYILAISNETRFEFLFTDVSGETARREEPIFASVFDVHQYVAKESIIFININRFLMFPPLACISVHFSIGISSYAAPLCRLDSWSYYRTSRCTARCRACGTCPVIRAIWVTLWWPIYAWSGTPMPMNRSTWACPICR